MTVSCGETVQRKDPIFPPKNLTENWQENYLTSELISYGCVDKVTSHWHSHPWGDYCGEQELGFSLLLKIRNTLLFLKQLSHPSSSSFPKPAHTLIFMLQMVILNLEKLSSKKFWCIWVYSDIAFCRSGTLCSVWMFGVMFNFCSLMCVFNNGG